MEWYFTFVEALNLTLGQIWAWRCDNVRYAGNRTPISSCTNRCMLLQSDFRGGKAIGQPLHTARTNMSWRAACATRWF